MTSDFLHIGHRGAAAYATENTLSSIQTAIACGVDMVELDVRKTRDDHLVLAHDPYIQGEGRKLKINRHTLDQLNHLCLPGGEMVTTLEQALRFIRGKALVNIDLKESGYEKRIVSLVEELDMKSQVMFSGLQAKSLQKVKQENPGFFVALSYPSSFLIRLYYIRWLQPMWNYFGNRKFLIQPLQRIIRKLLPYRAKRLKDDLGIDAIMVMVPFISPKLVDVIHQKELKLYAWPADKEVDVHKLHSLGVDGAGSNRPDILQINTEHLAS